MGWRLKLKGGTTSTFVPDECALFFRRQDTMKKITQFYELYDEDSRLQRDKAKRIEFITTTTFLNQYTQGNSKILEVGAGTGIYSFYFAERGHQVTATDVTPKHVEIMKSKLLTKPNLRMDVKEADATDLSECNHEEYDAVLCLGPMYHLISIEQQKRCISECLRVLKPGGILAVAYIPRFTVFPYLVKGDRKFLTEQWVNRIIDKGFTSSDEEDCFWTDAYFHTPDELADLMKAFDTEMLDHVASDGIGPILSHIVNELSDDEYDAWIKYHLKTCKEPSILGNSNHALYICRKGRGCHGEHSDQGIANES
jgi:ubiquinone/menaquinone biosynthesis C-methylase UbiE